MIDREKGWNLHGARTDLWRSYVDTCGTTRYAKPGLLVSRVKFDHFRYQNTLSGQSQIEAPPEFKGGCLADCMGLGKTLSMLSLIAANPRSAENLKDSGGALITEATEVVKATLIVVPFSRKTRSSNSW